MLVSRRKLTLFRISLYSFICLCSLKCYNEILNAQENLLHEDHIGRAITLKKLIFVHIKLHQYKEALSKLKIVVKIERSQGDHQVPIDKKTRKLIKLLEDKVDSNGMFELWDDIVDRLSSAGFNIFCAMDSNKKIDDSIIDIPRPRNRSKMTGHKIRMV